MNSFKNKNNHIFFLISILLLISFLVNGCVVVKKKYKVDNILVKKNHINKFSHNKISLIQTFVDTQTLNPKLKLKFLKTKYCKSLDERFFKLKRTTINYLPKPESDQDYQEINNRNMNFYNFSIWWTIGLASLGSTIYSIAMLPGASTNKTINSETGEKEMSEYDSYVQMSVLFGLSTVVFLGYSIYKTFQLRDTTKIVKKWKVENNIKVEPCKTNYINNKPVLLHIDYKSKTWNSTIVKLGKTNKRGELIVPLRKLGMIHNRYDNSIFYFKTKNMDGKNRFKNFKKFKIFSALFTIENNLKFNNTFFAVSLFDKLRETSKLDNFSGEILDKIKMNICKKNPIDFLKGKNDDTKHKYYGIITKLCPALKTCYKAKSLFFANQYCFKRNSNNFKNNYANNCINILKSYLESISHCSSLKLENFLKAKSFLLYHYFEQAKSSEKLNFYIGAKQLYKSAEKTLNTDYIKTYKVNNVKILNSNYKVMNQNEINRNILKTINKKNQNEFIKIKLNELKQSKLAFIKKQKEMELAKERERKRQERIKEEKRLKYEKEQAKQKRKREKARKRAERKRRRLAKIRQKKIKRLRRIRQKKIKRLRRRYRRCLKGSRSSCRYVLKHITYSYRYMKKHACIKGRLFHKNTCKYIFKKKYNSDIYSCTKVMRMDKQSLNRAIIKCGKGKIKCIVKDFFRRVQANYRKYSSCKFLVNYYYLWKKYFQS